MTENNTPETPATDAPVVYSLPRMSVEHLRTRREALDVLARLDRKAGDLLAIGETQMFEEGARHVHALQGHLKNSSGLIEVEPHLWDVIGTHVDAGLTWLNGVAERLA